MKDKRSNKIALAVFALISLLLFTFLFFFMTSKSAPSPSQDVTPQDWTQISVEDDGFTLSHPPDWQLSQCPKGIECPTNDDSIYLEIPITFVQSDKRETSYFIQIQNIPNEEMFLFEELTTRFLTSSQKNNFKYKEKEVNNYKVYTTSTYPDIIDAYSIFVTEDNSRFLKLSLKPYSTSSPHPEQETFKELLDKVVTTLTLSAPSTE